ncbi:MAG: carboxylesterase family protein [Saprospiraceae bacterium]|nr:carboxylesterase family protein [Saprospiraceae bacterium]
MRYATLPLWFIIGLLTGLHAQTVVTEYGPVSGLRQGSGYVFLGIPFASPPVGQLRWRPTEPPQSWSSPLPTMDFPPSCPQKHYTQGDTSYTLEGDEDCLYLNVWSPGLTGTYPVMVFIHGGGNQQGSSGETVGGITLYDGQQLSNRGKVVVVTIQYRLGILGYLVHPGLEAENAQGTSGNYGVMDQIFALQWVRDNIASFGGDPNNVTLFGESAGGVNVGNLMTCPAAKGLFHKAIIESAVPVLNAYTLAESEGVDLVNGFISSGSDVEKIAYMRSLPADDLSRTQSNPVQGGIVQQTWQPVVDHQLFTDFPNQVFQSGSYHQVPLIIGSNADEMRPGVPPIVTPGQVRALVNIAVPVAYRDAVLSLYPPGNTNAEAKDAYAGILTDGQFTSTTRRTAQCVSLNQSEPVWRYFFTHTNSFPTISEWRSFHGLELFYVFNNLSQSLFALGPWYTDDDKKVEKYMLDYWTHFAYTGDPNDGLAPNWPVYQASTDCFLNINAHPDGSDCGIRTEKCNLWDEAFGFMGCTGNLTAIPPSSESISTPEVYPNPANGLVHVTWSGTSLTTTVFDVLGHALTIIRGNRLDLSHLSPGTYLLVINNGESQCVRKICLTR